MSKAKSTQLDTVSIIVMKGSVLQSIVSFPDTPEGNKEAEATFAKQAKRFLCAEGDIEACIEDGTYSLEPQGIDVFLAHSCAVKDFLTILL